MGAVGPQVRPGQTRTNELEQAVLERIAVDDPALARGLDDLHVLSREYTGAGSFTNFALLETALDGAQRHLGWNGLVRLPGVPSGLGAVLFCQGDRPTCLELYAFGDEHWDGVHDGFRLEERG